MSRLIGKARHAVQWRWQRFADRIAPLLTRYRIQLRWRFHRRGKPHHLPAKLIVSLTSYPARFDSIQWTLRCLLSQTVRADKTILWVDHAAYPLLPKCVTNLQRHGLTICATEDIRSYTKILPTLALYPEAFICTADDDVYYRSDWLQELVADHSGDLQRVRCRRAHQIISDHNGAYLPYAQWHQDVVERGRLPSLFPTGVGGVLYPPGILAHPQSDAELISTLCPFGDDIWLYWIGRRNGATYQTVGSYRKLVDIGDSHIQPLWHANVLQGRNDEMIHNMAEHYGYPAND